jgi:hypothetical protein
MIYLPDIKTLSSLLSSCQFSGNLLAYEYELFFHNLRCSYLVRIQSRIFQSIYSLRRFMLANRGNTHTGLRSQSLFCLAAPYGGDLSSGHFSVGAHSE